MKTVEAIENAIDIISKKLKDEYALFQITNLLNGIKSVAKSDQAEMEKVRADHEVLEAAYANAAQLNCFYAKDIQVLAAELTALKEQNKRLGLACHGCRGSKKPTALEQIGEGKE